MLWKCCTQYASKFGKLSSGHRTGKMSVFIPIPKKGNAKGCSKYHIVALTSCASKVMLKILQARLQQCVNWELLDVKAEFRKGRGTRDQTANIQLDHRKNKGIPEKHISAALTTLKPLTVWITKSWDYQPTLPASWETCLQVKKQQNWIWNNRLVPNWERSMSKLYIVTLLI